VLRFAMLSRFALMCSVCRFVRIAQLPDEIEMLLNEQSLGVSAAFASVTVVSLVERVNSRCLHQRCAFAFQAPTAS
jgi:hypothetical protein